MATDLKPIRNEADYDQALTEVERLWGAATGSPDGDRLEVMAALIEDYEDRHYPMALPDPIDAIQFRMDQQGLTAEALEKLTGVRIGDILARRRPLTIAAIRKLHDKLGIPAEVLIQPTRKERAA
jgi:HTH-type transcriptional regulator / antitoxin HigA